MLLASDPGLAPNGTRGLRRRRQAERATCAQASKQPSLLATMRPSSTGNGAGAGRRGKAGAATKAPSAAGAGGSGAAMELELVRARAAAAEANTRAAEANARALELQLQLARQAKPAETAKPMKSAARKHAVMEDDEGSASEGATSDDEDGPDDDGSASVRHGRSFAFRLRPLLRPLLHWPWHSYSLRQALPCTASSAAARPASSLTTRGVPNIIMLSRV